MEPSDLNDPLEAALRKSGTTPLPDNGFSTRVLAALPPSQRKSGWSGMFDVQAILLWAAGLAALFVVMGHVSLNAKADSLLTSVTGLLANSWSSLGIAAAVIACLYALYGEPGSERSRD